MTTIMVHYNEEKFDGINTFKVEHSKRHERIVDIVFEPEVNAIVLMYRRVDGVVECDDFYYIKDLLNIEVLE